MITYRKVNKKPDGRCYIQIPKIFEQEFGISQGENWVQIALRPKKLIVKLVKK